LPLTTGVARNALFRLPLAQHHGWLIGAILPCTLHPRTRNLLRIFLPGYTALGGASPDPVFFFGLQPSCSLESRQPKLVVNGSLILLPLRSGPSQPHARPFVRKIVGLRLSRLTSPILDVSRRFKSLQRWGYVTEIDGDAQQFRSWDGPGTFFRRTFCTSWSVVSPSTHVSIKQWSPGLLGRQRTRGQLHNGIHLLSGDFSNQDNT